MSLAAVLRHEADVGRRFGPRAALHDVRHRVINRVIAFHVLECASMVPSDVPPRFLDPGGFSGVFAERQAMLAHAGAEYDMTPQFIAQAFDRGDECFALYDGARLASCSWYSRRPTPISDDLLVHFDPAWSYTYGAFTHPDYRGRRLYPIGLALVMRAYAARGLRGVLSYVNSTNFPSIRTRAVTGQRVFGKIYLVGWRERWLVWSTRGCRAYGFRVESLAARSTRDARA